MAATPVEIARLVAALRIEILRERLENYSGTMRVSFSKLCLARIVGSAGRVGKMHKEFRVHEDVGLASRLQNPRKVLAGR